MKREQMIGLCVLLFLTAGTIFMVSRYPTEQGEALSDGERARRRSNGLLCQRRPGAGERPGGGSSYGGGDVGDGRYGEPSRPLVSGGRVSGPGPVGPDLVLRDRP